MCIMGMTVLSILGFIALVIWFFRNHFNNEKKIAKERKEEEVRNYYVNQKTLLFILVHYVRVYGYDSEIEKIIETIEKNENMTNTIRDSLIKKIKQISDHERLNNGVYITFGGVNDVVHYKDRTFFLISYYSPFNN